MSRFSDIARPPITQDEAEKADHSICPYHNGLVRETGDVEGRVMYCPIGNQYWRYTKRSRNGMYSPLNYPKSGVI